MKTLSQLLKVGSIATVVLAILLLLLDKTGLLSGLQYSFEGNIHFTINCQTFLFYIQHFILIFFFIALIIDKANDRKIMIASGAGILGNLLYMSYIVLFFICNQLPGDLVFKPMLGTNIFSVVNIVRYSLGTLLVLAGFVLIYVFSARKERMMLPVIITCSMLLISYFSSQFLWKLVGYETYYSIVSPIIIVLESVSYAFSMYMYAYDIDKSQPMP